MLFTWEAACTCAQTHAATHPHKHNHVPSGKTGVDWSIQMRVPVHTPTRTHTMQNDRDSSLLIKCNTDLQPLRARSECGVLSLMQLQVGKDLTQQEAIAENEDILQAATVGPWTSALTQLAHYFLAVWIYKDCGKLYVYLNSSYLNLLILNHNCLYSL